MTAQEQEMIDGLVERIRSTQVTDKDVAAEQHLQAGLAGTPDATYIMAQTILVQQYGLQQAQQQIQSLQGQLDQANQQLEQARQASQTSGGSFLSHIFGSGQQQAPPAPPSQGYGPSQVPYQQVNAPTYPPAYQGGYATGYPGQQVVYGQPMYQQQPMGYGMGGGGGFLRGAMQTAAGVAMGEMMFQGVEDLFRGFGGGHERGFDGGRPEEIVNNYYGDSGGREHEHISQDDGSFYQPGHDAASQSEGHSSSFADTSDVSSDDNSFDDAGSIDSPGGDDGGSFSDDNS